MADTTPRSNTAFSRASQPATPDGQSMALIIDIQGAKGMSDADATAYFNKLGQDIDSMRQRGIPVTWVTMADRNHLYEPTAAGDGVSLAGGNGANADDYSTLIDRGFYGAKPDEPGHEIFRKFLREHGPRTSDAIYTKFFKGAFVEPEDYANDPALRAQIQNDYGRQPNGEPFDLPEAGAYDGPTLTQYARDRGVKNVLIVGAVSTHCVTQTAVTALKKGFGAQIGVDDVLSWQGDENKVNPRTSTLLWRGGDAILTQDDFHRRKINERLDQMTPAEKTAWGLTDDDIDSIRRNIVTASEFNAAPGARTPTVTADQTTRTQPVPTAPTPT